jgi:signal transduction histidine kinase
MGINRRNRISKLWFAWLVLSLSLTSRANDSLYTEKHVLVLHSYHQGLEWTDNITTGIQSVFKSEKDINLVFEYLDFKRNSNKEYYEAFLNLYQKKVKKIPFSAIIVSDNFAFDFMKEHANEYYPGIPVFFCGVNNLKTEDLLGYPNFYGVRESIDYKGTIESIIKIFPERKNILVVCDNTLTGKAVQVEMKKVTHFFKGKLNFEYVSDISLEELKGKVSKLTSDYAIYLLVFNRDKNGVYVSYRNGLKHIQSVSKVPIFGSWDFYMSNGLLGGKITLGADQGKYAALLAKKYLDGENFDTIPQIRSSITKYIFNYNELQKFGIKEKHLPENSVILNKPPEKENLTRLFISISLLFAVVVILLLVLLQLRKKRALKLERIIQERTTALTEMNTELKDIIEKKDKFFSILAHDLRNRVGTLFSFTKFLNDSAKKKSPEALEEIYSSVAGAAKTTFNLLEDLLYWGRKQFSKRLFLNPTEFNISELLNAIADDFKINQNHVAINQSLIPDLLITSDRDVCKFVFRNLIQNAIKFSPVNGDIFIRTELTNENQVKIFVIDKGIGMSEEIIQSIFNKQPILQEGTNGEVGTGIGLPTVIDYLELLKTELKIESKIGKGTSFEILFL